MASSLVKFSHRHGTGAKRLWWGRAEQDGAPFRGPMLPLMTDEEFDTRVVRVADVRNAFFDVNDPAQNQQYLDVLECCYNGWFQLVHLERFWNNSMAHYVEWAEFYMEDGTRTPYLSGAIMELAHGQQHIPGDLAPGTNGTG